MKNVHPISHPPETQHPGAHNQPVGSAVTPAPAHASHVSHTPQAAHSTNPNTPSNKKKIPIILLVVGLLLAGGSIGYWALSRSPQSSVNIAPEQRRVADYEEPAIAKVGSEIIFASDLATELAYYPSLKEVEGVPTKAYLLEKIITDSILLQELASPEELDATIFNSPTKDYLKRTQLTQKLREQKEAEILEEAPGPEGILINIWYRNVFLVKYEYDEAKNIAFEKITSLHSRVSQGVMSPEDAIAAIKNDASLADLDINYQGNAFGTFKVLENKNITLSAISPQLLQDVLRAEPGDVTEIYDAKISNDEEYYAFAVINEVPKNAAASTTFESWLTPLRETYAIEIYET